MANEKRLIDANALIEHLENCIGTSNGLISSACVAIKCYVEQMPTVEVVHWRWIKHHSNRIPPERNVHNNAMRGGIRKALRCLEQCQSVTDMVEVVRCKDCKHNEDCIRRIQFWGRNPVLELNTSEYHPIDYCSYGERRTDE